MLPCLFRSPGLERRVFADKSMGEESACNLLMNDTNMLTPWTLQSFALRASDFWWCCVTEIRYLLFLITDLAVGGATTGRLDRQPRSLPSRAHLLDRGPSFFLFIPVYILRSCSRHTSAVSPKTLRLVDYFALHMLPLLTVYLVARSRVPTSAILHV